MKTKHVPSLELCQELDTLCKENNITLPETEFYWKVGKASGHANLTTDKPDLENWTKTDDGFDWYHAPLVSEQGEWLKDYMEDKENDGEAVPDDMPKADRMGLLWEPNFMQKTLNYLLAEGIITTL